MRIAAFRAKRAALAWKHLSLFAKLRREVYKPVVFAKQFVKRTDSHLRKAGPSKGRNELLRSVLSGPVLRDTARLSQRCTRIARYGVFGVTT